MPSVADGIGSNKDQSSSAKETSPLKNNTASSTTTQKQPTRSASPVGKGAASAATRTDDRPHLSPLRRLVSRSPNATEASTTTGASAVQSKNAGDGTQSRSPQPPANDSSTTEETTMKTAGAIADELTVIESLRKGQGEEIDRYIIELR